MNELTTEQIIWASKITEDVKRIQRAAVTIYGEELPERLKPYIATLEGVMQEKNTTNVFEIIAEVAKNVNPENNPLTIMLLVSAAYEITTKPQQNEKKKP